MDFVRDNSNNTYIVFIILHLYYNLSYLLEKVNSKMQQEKSILISDDKIIKFIVNRRDLVFYLNYLAMIQH